MHSPNTNPHYNLAMEEHLLKKFTDDFFILWQSEPAVVVGKHQNVLAEMNYRFVRDNGIRVARRLTGGGTVYHDAGNINFTFIRTGEPGKQIDFGKYIKPVTGFLKSLGVDAVQGPKNEILVAGKKISGNAEHVHKNRVLHHGTLLFNSNLASLNAAISRNSGKFTDKAVQSNRSRVLNLAACLHREMTVMQLMQAFLDYVILNCDGRLTDMANQDDAEIEQLIREKYDTWEWIYGWSPDYEFENTWQRGEIKISIQLKTHRGNITGCILGNSGLSPEILNGIQQRLTGLRHEEGEIKSVLESSELNSILTGSELTDLVLAFF
ncbi:MAG: lipoate--protein ligase [Bacteroidales bacterium]|nr:lipoate--protein ligase [Bacteroidales bacterium]